METQNTNESQKIRATKEDLLACCNNHGADLVGIANIERFSGVKAEHHPQSIFPECRSVIVLGKQIPRGAFRGVEEGSNFANYGVFGVHWIADRFLPMLTINVAEYLEDRGWEAVAMPNIPSEIPALGEPVSEGKPAPNVLIDFNDAAVRAGLGEIGYNGEFMTPQYGIRQRMQIILTDAVLEADPICEEEVCDRCKKCASSCPIGAYDECIEQEIVICDKKMLVAIVNEQKCSICKNGALKNQYRESAKMEKLAALCNRTCIHHIEQQKNRFRSDFRQRPAWQVDINGKSSLVNGEM